MTQQNPIPAVVATQTVGTQTSLTMLTVDVAGNLKVAATAPVSPVHKAATLAGGANVGYLVKLGPAGLAALTTTQLGALTQSQLTALTSASAFTDAVSVNTLTSANLQALTTTAINALSVGAVYDLSTTNLATLTATEILTLATSQVATLTTTQVNALTTTELRGLAPQTVATIDLHNTPALSALVFVPGTLQTIVYD